MNPSTNENVAAWPSRSKRLVALVGNPNSGKTTLFNALTGAKQKVGNYPGVTVERISADITIGDLAIEVHDVPGLYSLTPISEDERVAVSAINDAPDLVVCVMDAHNLERNLFLASQLAERELPLIIVLTMSDLVEKSGGSIDVARLANLLGVDVIPVVAHKRIGLQALKECIAENLANPKRAKHLEMSPSDGSIRAASLRERLLRMGFDVKSTEIEEWLGGGSEALSERLSAFPEVMSEFEAAKAEMVLNPDGTSPKSPESRYAWASMTQRAVFRAEAGRSVRTLSDRIDKILINRVLGFAIFVVLMYGVFQSIYTLSGPLMEGIGWCFNWIASKISPSLSSMPVVQSAVVDGLIGGIGAVLVFLPQIIILFFFIAVLEGTGYLARAAFLMDRLLGWCGLNGRAFIPLLSSFACAIPGVMAARVIPDSRSRLATILVAPLMSCSARLPVYILMIGTFIEPKFGPLWAGFALFAMHFLGVLVAVPIVWVLNRKVLKGKRLPFLLELPPYQWPKWRDVFLAMFLRAKVFLSIAGTTIVAMSMIIWALLFFPRSAERDEKYRQDYRTQFTHSGPTEEQYISMRRVEDSYLGKFGKALEPVFAPAGFDWRISTAILAAFPARELVVPTLGIIFSLGEGQDEASKDLQHSLSTAKRLDGTPLVTASNAIGLMVFFALCAQCFSTLAVVRRETNSIKWPVFMFCYMSTLAYMGAVIVNQVGKLF